MKSIFFLLFFLNLTTQTFAQDKISQLRVKEYNIGKDKLALNGMDPVSYFAEKPVKGISSINAQHQGVIYYFANAGNRKLFLATPSKYEPQFGGWCAYAMGNKAKKQDVDPTTYKIINGKLYLFYNAFFNNTLKSWNKDEKSLLEKANSNWLKIEYNSNN